MQPWALSLPDKELCLREALAFAHPRPLSLLQRGLAPRSKGKAWLRIFPDKPYTRKPADVRMGKGKGDVAGYVAPVHPGRILIEVDGVSFDIAKEALRLAAQKLPVTTKFVVRRDYDPTQNV